MCGYIGRMTSGNNTQHITCAITRIDPRHHDIKLPAYATEGSAGMDVCAAVDADIVVRPGERTLVPTGFAIALPHGHEAQIRPRSGLAIKHGIGILNGPGTIDSDYRGEVKIILINLGHEDFVIRRGDRIAQMIISRYERVEWQEVGELSETDRGAGGFGHTGTASRT